MKGMLLKCYYPPFGLNAVETVRKEEWALQENNLLNIENMAASDT